MPADNMMLLYMECADEEPALASRHNHLVSLVSNRAQNLNARAALDDSRRSDEHAVHGSPGEGYVDVGLEGFALGAEMIAIDSNIEAANERLAACFTVLCPVGKQNHASAGAENRDGRFSDKAAKWL